MFVKGIEFLKEEGGQEQFVEMGFGGNGAAVSPWSVLFFCFFLLFNFVSCGGKKGGGKLLTGPPSVAKLPANI
jgi:hypothetical protein